MCDREAQLIRSIIDTESRSMVHFESCLRCARKPSLPCAEGRKLLVDAGVAMLAAKIYVDHMVEQERERRPAVAT